MGNKRITFEPGKLYHVYNHGNGDDCIFRSEENYYYFLRKYSEYIYPVVETFAYCLMPNHFHLLVRIREEEALQAFLQTKNPPGFQNLAGLVSRQFSNFFNSYAKSFNKMYNRRGGLFIDDAKRKHVENKQYFSRLIAYIHLNPVLHGFVRQPEDWKHSSYHTYLLQKPTKLAKEEGLEWFGDKADFIRLHRELAAQDIFKEFDI